MNCTHKNIVVKPTTTHDRHFHYFACLLLHSGQAMRINVQLCVSGCEGSTLVLNGEETPFVRGKAIAWQDGWRHEIVNAGSEARYVFMFTLAHPELQWARGTLVSADGREDERIIYPKDEYKDEHRPWIAAETAAEHRMVQQYGDSRVFFGVGLHSLVSI